MDQTPPPGGTDDTDPPAPAGPHLLGRATRTLAGVAIVAYLAGGVLLALPVRNPVQDCGSPAAYLYQGRADVIPDGRDQILDGDEVVTLAPEVADAARATPCQDRVAARAAPAGALLAGATGVGTAAFALELLAVRPRRRRALPVGTPAPMVPDGPDSPA